MHRPAVETLFKCLERHLEIAQGAAIVCMPRARYHPALEQFDNEQLYLLQTFRPHAAQLEVHGLKPSPALPETADLVLFVATKHKMESLCWIARGLALLKPGGTIAVSAELQLGGKSYRKELFALAGEGQSWSKEHCVVSWVKKDPAALVQARIHELAAQAGPRTIAESSYVTQLGVYGGEKVDEGSALLASLLPADLRGSGADFGCGYGHLAAEALRRSPAITALALIDAEALALEVCRTNIKALKTTVRCDYLWRDISSHPFDHEYDFVLMNPPHHSSEKQDFDLGRRFIAQARAALKPGARLFLVANEFLPYEEALEAHFAACSQLGRSAGFKTFCATA